MPTNEEWDALLRAVNESRSPLDWNAIRCAILHAKEANTLKADNARLKAELAALAAANKRLRKPALAIVEELEGIEETHGDCSFCNPDEAYGPHDATGHTPDCLYQAVKWLRTALSSPSPGAKWKAAMRLAEAALGLAGFDENAPEGNRITCILCGRPKNQPAPGCEWHELTAAFRAACEEAPDEG